MKQIPFGPDRIPVSRLALGTWTFAGDAVWSASSETECIRVVHAALDAGVNLFDSAPNYGSGRSEGILGMALKGRPEALVSTKFKVDGTATANDPAINAIMYKASSNQDCKDWAELYNPNPFSSFFSAFLSMLSTRSTGSPLPKTRQRRGRPRTRRNP